MWQEEPSFFVNQKLVKMSRQFAVLKSQFMLHVGNDFLDQFLPFRVCQLELIGVKFPGSPHISIDQRF